MTDIVIVGEAWGSEEEQQQAPFVGPSGKLLRGLLSSVGIAARECFLTNVFNLRPQPTNNISNLCVSKGTHNPRAHSIKDMRSLGNGRWVRAEFAPELQRLYTEIRNANPNLIIALGGTALWALTGQSKIKANRGTVIESHLHRSPSAMEGDLREPPGFKVMRDWYPHRLPEEVYVVEEVLAYDLLVKGADVSDQAPRLNFLGVGAPVVSIGLLSVEEGDDQRDRLCGREAYAGNLVAPGFDVDGEIWGG